MLEEFIDREIRFLVDCFFEALGNNIVEYMKQFADVLAREIYTVETS